MIIPSLQYLHQGNSAALVRAASSGNADVVKLLLEAGASTEAKGTVSKRTSICTCVCVCVCVCVIFLHHSVVLFSSSILLL